MIMHPGVLAATMGINKMTRAVNGISGFIGARSLRGMGRSIGMMGRHAYGFASNRYLGRDAMGARAGFMRSARQLGKRAFGYFDARDVGRGARFRTSAGRIGMAGLGAWGLS